MIIETIEMNINISGSLYKFKEKRNETNLYIANRIYIELITRKAAIPFEEDKDVIVKIYDSWYKLFGIIRDEIKSVSGSSLYSHDPTKGLSGLSIKILNEALRPHLTTYQADIRRWHERWDEKETKINVGYTSLQDVQKEYRKYKCLIADMKKVNKNLMDYSKELYKFIQG